ncbi:hypothetical protein N7508_010532 [Penicillium antarcticum]|uniref:uncharacterized protein n=1 Tax=Penicillium antarcticum TaxID=416450 RepID=UPI00238ACAD8|nr:uncharacterized protein N7508_010532 [Penicillium antarcticum]KAJ5295711.1 hypothetical protein N7508_010532 [Penicillium antarcticum]
MTRHLRTGPQGHGRKHASRIKGTTKNPSLAPQGIQQLGSGLQRSGSKMGIIPAETSNDRPLKCNGQIDRANTTWSDGIFAYK